MFKGVGVIEIDEAALKRLALVMFGDRASVVVLGGLGEGFLSFLCGLDITNDDLTRRWKLGEEDMYKRAMRYDKGVGCATLITRSSWSGHMHSTRCLSCSHVAQLTLFSLLLPHKLSSEPLICSNQVSVARW